jgi:hypothetical protein
MTENRLKASNILATAELLYCSREFLEESLSSSCIPAASYQMTARARPYPYQINSIASQTKSNSSHTIPRLKKQASSNINNGSGTQLRHNLSSHTKLGASSADEELRGSRRSCPLSTVRRSLINWQLTTICNVLIALLLFLLLSMAQSFRKMSPGQGTFWIPYRY